MEPSILIKVIRTIIEEAHMAGQWNHGRGVDPSYYNAQEYCNEVMKRNGELLSLITKKGE